MTILFLIINYPSSVGEITNICLFANELIKNNINCYFYQSNALVESYLNFYNFKLVTKNDLVNIDFDLVILSEYFSLFNKNYLKEDKELFDFINNNFFKKNIPVATIDILGLGSSKEEILNNFISNPKLKKNYSDIIIPNEKYFFSIKPCPINTPSNLNLKNNNFYWSLPKLDSNLENQNKVKKMFDIPENAKIIFLPISKWKYFQWKNKYSSEFIFKLGKQIFNLISSINFETDTYFFFGVPNYQVQKFQNKNFTFCYFNPEAENYIQPQIFDIFLSMSNVILTINLIQNSFTRALASRINGINLTNGLDFDEKMIPSYFKDVNINNSYTVKNFPFQDSNDYVSLFETFEIFDENFIKHLEKLLLDNDFYKSKFDNYTKLLENSCYTSKDICLKIKNL